MLRVKVWNKSVPRVEINHRARDARLRLERIEEQLVPRANATALWYRRVVCLFSFRTSGGVSRFSRIRGSLSHQRLRMLQFARGLVPVAG